MEKINVNLYGGKSIFKGKENPLRAEIIYCDNKENCSLYKEGKCINVTTPFGNSCKIGKVEIKKGYTSRAKKYYEFKNKYEKDEVYNKLKYPNNTIISIIKDDVYLDMPYIFFEFNESEKKYNLKVNTFNTKANWIPLEYFDCNLIYDICNAKPQAMMGGTITSYSKEKVPNMLFELKKILPELYKDFILKYPEYDIVPNHIGKYAYINTLNKNSKLKDCLGNIFRIDNNYLYCENYKTALLPFSGEIAEIKIPITDNMTYQITDNSQVTENTKFT